MKEKNNIRLSILGLPAIQTIEDFSQLIHVSKQTIYQLSVFSEKNYRVYEIDKKNGSKRTISQPSASLKGLQGWILVNILNKLNVSNSCKGFEKGSSTADNARPHKEANCVLTIDLKDFFGTVSDKQVYNVFRSIGYNQLISTMFTNICTYKGALPQGGPCSPRLANLVSWKLDKRIQGYVGRKGITYTRYADDMTFSGLHPSKVSKIVPTIERIVKDEGFTINESKTRIAGAGRAKIVTGLVISNSSFGVGKRTYQKLRAKIHHLTLDSEQDNFHLLNEVYGWLSYLNSVDKRRLKSAKRYIKELCEKHPKAIINDLITAQEKD